MARSVRLHADFLEDLEGQLEWLRKNRQVSWIDALEIGIDEAIALLSVHPAAGVAQNVAAGGASDVRKVILRRLPFVVWYSVDLERDRSSVWLLRLFHVRQRGFSAERRRGRR